MVLYCITGWRLCLRLLYCLDFCNAIRIASLWLYANVGVSNGGPTSDPTQTSSLSRARYLGAPRTPASCNRSIVHQSRLVVVFAFAGWSSSVVGRERYDDAVTDVLGKHFHYANCYISPFDDKTSVAVYFFVATFSIFPPIKCYINHNFFQCDNE